MSEHSRRIRLSVNWGGRIKILSWMVVLGVVLSLIGPLAVSLPASAARVQPVVLSLAARSPDQPIRVIVQKTVKDDRVERAARALGGKVIKDLAIINAFAAEMKSSEAVQLARTDGVRWVSLDATMQEAQTGEVTTEAVSVTVEGANGTVAVPAGASEFTTWANVPGIVVANAFTNAANMVDSALGPNATYGYGSRVKGAFGGFAAEATPGYAISKVEIVLRAYSPIVMSAGSDPKLTMYVNGKAGKAVVLNHHAFDTCVGVSLVCTVYVDMTADHVWKWSDFEAGLELLIDQSGFNSKDKLYYDAIGLRVTSTPGSDAICDSGGDASALATIDSTKQANFYNQIIRSSNLWNTSAKLQGKGVTIAVVDSGIFKTKDLGKRVRGSANFNAAYHDAADRYGHGTFVAGIVAGSGSQSGYKYIGVAPRADVLNIRVSDDQGMSTESDVVSGLQWVLDNKTRYNIRVVNLSLNSSVAQSYHTSPLDAACEILWFNGIVVVVSAGNNGTTTLFPPANDPFVITVGATDDRATLSTADDTVAAFSAYGTTESGFAKPDLVTPGRNIIGLLPENDNLNMSAARAANRIDKTYFKMSGTSASAPMVSGAVALLLQDEPNLTPDQVKYRLMATANKNWLGYSATTAGAGYLDIYAAVEAVTTQSANTSVMASQLLWTGSTPPVWDSVQWGSVQWGSVQWGSVQWGSVQWGSVQWGSDYWGP